MTISGLDTPFDHSFCLPTLSDQAVNVFSANNFASDTCSSLLSYYRYLLCPSPHQAVIVSSIDKPTNRHSCSTSSSTFSQTLIGADTFQNHNPCPRHSYNSCHCLNMVDSLKTMNQGLLRPKDWISPTIPNSQKIFAKLPTIDISMIGATPFNTLVQQASHAKNMEILSILICDIEKALAPKSTTNSAKKLLTEYHDFFDVFFQADWDILPPHHPYDHRIPLMEEKNLPWGPLYSMSQDELKVLKKYLEKNLSKGFIRASFSPTASPVLFACKPKGGLWFCVDYRQLNAITINNQYLLPLIKETLGCICKVKIYSKIDIIAVFKRLRMQ